MLNVAVLGLDVVGVEVGNGRNVGMGNLAVIALVVVVGEDLPVELALHVPCVVKDIVLEIVVLESRLLIDTVKVVLPGYLRRLATIQVDPDEAVLVDMRVNRREVLAQESFDVPLVVFGDDKLVASGVIWHPVARVGDAVLMGGQKPLSREDRSPFQLVHGLGGVPGRRQGTDGLLLLLCHLFCRWGGRPKEIPEE